jgi:hypothetical protein
VILFVNPDKEVSGFVMENTTSIRPVAATSRRQKKGRVRLLEKVSSVSESFFFSSGHTVRLGSIRSRSSEREIISFKFSIKLHETLDNAVLNITSLLERVARRKSESSDTTSSSATCSKNVLASRIYFSVAKVSRVHVGRMLGVGSISSMTVRDNFIEKLSKESPGFFVTSNKSASLNHRVALVVNTSLNAVTEIHSKLGLFSL